MDSRTKKRHGNGLRMSYSTASEPERGRPAYTMDFGKARDRVLCRLPPTSDLPEHRGGGGIRIAAERLMHNTYVDTQGQVYYLVHLDTDERKLLAGLQRKANSGVSWDEFDNHWLPRVASFYKRRRLTRRQTIQTVPYQIAQDLSSRIALAKGLVRLSDCHGELEEIIRTRFKTQAHFCKATGLSSETVRQVLAGRKHLDIETLEAALARIGYGLRIVPRPETPIPQRHKAGA
jgi:hypothetical protein